MKRNIDLFFAPYVILVVAAFLMFFDLFRLLSKPNINLFDVTSPIVYCFLIAIAFIICLIYSLITDAVKYKKADKNEDTILINKDLKASVLFVGGLAMYILLLPILHFQIATFLLVATIMFLLNNSNTKMIVRLLKSIISSGILIPLIVYVFSGIFHVKLP